MALKRAHCIFFNFVAGTDLRFNPVDAMDPGYITGSDVGLDPVNIAKYRCPPTVFFGMRSPDTMASM